MVFTHAWVIKQNNVTTNRQGTHVFRLNVGHYQ